ncbi:hypothetical protein AB0E27_24710 [Streptomyces sparsogenes]|uniref:hypothetical protein n=1 Tax=Streptomyces sparsogenes TaxID=67365 RepID=UPI0033FD94C1
MPEAKQRPGESAELKRWRGNRRQFHVLLWAGVAMGAAAAGAGAVMAARCYGRQQSEEAATWIIMVCLGVIQITVAFMWMNVKKWRDIVVEQRFAFEQAQIAWENDRAELIATACQTVMSQLRSELAQSVEQDPPQLRLVKPHNERSNGVGC